MTQYRWGYCKSTIEGTLSSCDRSTVIATAYPKSTLNSTPTCSSLSGTGSYETHIAGKEKYGCVGSDITSILEVVKKFGDPTYKFAFDVCWTTASLVS